MDAARREAAFAKANSDLRFLLDREQVGEELQAMLFEADVTTVRTFGALAADATELRALAKSDFGIDYQGGLKHKVQVSKLVCCWESARRRSAKMDEADQERELMNKPKQVLVSDYQAMRNAF